MICKFFNRGKGNTGPVEYVMKQVAIGKGAVLYGDPKITKKIIYNLKHQKQKYKSGVLTFLESEVDEQTKDEIINTFKSVMFPGMSEEQYDLLLVEHTNTDHYHIHFVIPRVELTTLKAFNPYWKGADLKRIDTFTNYVNQKFKLQSPIKKDKATTILSDELLKAKKKDIKSSLDYDLMMAVLAKQINSRDDVIIYLKKMGYALTREGKNYISIKRKGKKAIRLKGKLYDEDFTSVDYLKEEVQTYKSAPSKDETSIQKLEEKLEELIEQKALYNNERYSNPIQEFEEEEFNDNKKEQNYESQTTTENRQSGGDFETLTSTISKLAYGARKLTRKSGEILSTLRRVISLAKKSIGADMSRNNKLKTINKGMKL